MSIRKQLREYIHILRGKYSPRYPRALQWMRYSLPRHKLAIPIQTHLLSDVRTVEAFTHSKVQNIFEIGANFAQDGAFLALKLHIPHQKVYVFEAHPDICTEIHKFYPGMNITHAAVFNEEKDLQFNAIDIYKSDNSGISSLLNRNDTAQYMKNIQVKAIRMDHFMQKHQISSIDFVKIDTEGCTWEVLDSFGTQLSNIKAIQLEAETYPYWENQKLFKDVQELLIKNNFYMVSYVESADHQCDSLWINKKFIPEFTR